MSDYTSTTDVKAQIPEGFSSTDTSYDTLLGTLITAASRAIDAEVGRWPNYFYPSTDAETRYYDGNGGEILTIDDAVSVSSVAVSENGGLASTDYTTWSSTDYITWPYNSTPIVRLVVDTLNGSYSEFDAYPKGVKVTGIFGYSATPPEDVRQACEIQVLRWFMRAKNAYADSGAGADFPQVSVEASRPPSRLDADVASLLWKYKVANSF